MSLDKNLFTLTFTPHKDNPNVIDLVDPSGTVHYRKQRVTGIAEYRIEVYDPTTESLLATAYAPTASTKVRTIELYNPNCTVEMRYTGTYSFKWSFKWEEHELEWKREECFIVRKPDPPVIVSVTKEPAGRLKTTTVQILDYNLNRFDIDDRKGLEIVILTSLLTFSDANEAAHLEPPVPSKGATSRVASFAPSLMTAGANLNELPPPPPPKPAPKTGVERIAEMQAGKGEYNEVIISDEGSVPDYAQYCNTLLQDDAMLFVSVKSADAEQVPKVLQVVEETKRIRYKAGLDEEEGLHQYVLYDQKEPRKGPRIINLDDEKKNKYAPPKNLTVHLSKISMPELQPKAAGNEKQNTATTKSSSRKEEKKAAQQRPGPSPALDTSSSGSPSSKGAMKSQQRPPPPRTNTPPSKYAVDSKQPLSGKYPVDAKQQIATSSKHPVDPKQQNPSPKYPVDSKQASSSKFPVDSKQPIATSSKQQNPPPRYPVDSKQPSSGKYPVDTKQPIATSSKHPVDPKQQSFPPKYPVDIKQPSSSKYPIDSKQPIATSSKQQNPPPKYPVDSKQPSSGKYPVDSKQPMSAAPPAQYTSPPIYQPRPYKKGFEPTYQAGPHAAGPSSSGGGGGSNQYLSPVPGGWSGTSPAPTPPPPSYENGDHGKSNVAMIAQGASTVVHGFLGMISNGKSK